MTGYAVTARIDRVRPRRAQPSCGARVTRHVPLRPTDDRIAPTAEDPGPGPSERWGRVRDRWSQLWFYVWDAESWR